MSRLILRLLVFSGIFVVFAPLILTIYVSTFSDSLIRYPPSGHTFAWYPESVAYFSSPILTSFYLAAISATISLVLGALAGIALSRYSFVGKEFLSNFLVLPLAIPGIAIGLGVYICAILLEMKTGFRSAGTLILLILAHVLITLPWVVRISMASLTNADRSVEEAAASLGASPMMVIWRVTLPCMRSGLIASAMFAFIISFENLEMSLFLIAPGMTTLPISIFQYLEYNLDPLVAAISVVQIVVIGSILLAMARFANLGKITQ